MNPLSSCFTFLFDVSYLYSTGGAGPDPWWWRVGSRPRRPRPRPYTTSGHGLSHDEVLTTDTTTGASSVAHVPDTDVGGSTPLKTHDAKRTESCSHRPTAGVRPLLSGVHRLDRQDLLVYLTQVCVGGWVRIRWSSLVPDPRRRGNRFLTVASRVPFPTGYVMRSPTTISRLLSLSSQWISCPGRVGPDPFDVCRRWDPVSLCEEDRPYCVPSPRSSGWRFVKITVRLVTHVKMRSSGPRHVRVSFAPHHNLTLSTNVWSPRGCGCVKSKRR